MVDKKCFRFFGIFLALIIVVLSIYFVFAAHVITTSPVGNFSVNESTNNLFNITVNNTDVGQASNITSVNITLPSGASCVFADGSNASSVGSNGTAVADTFANVSNTLSWTNTTGYVINGSEWKYFWFNATCATPGTFNITVRTTNDTKSYETNLSFEINDTTAPNITLISPANATSSTTSAYNFTFNVSDDSDVSNCSLILDGSVINTLTSVSKTATNGMYNSSLSVATHTWSINCTDSLGNIGNSSNRTLIVTSSATTPDDTTDDPSSGSIPPTHLLKKIHSWTKITPGVVTIMKDFDKEIGIKQIQIEVKNEAQNVKVTVIKYDSKPAEVSVEKSGKVQKYLQISALNLEDKLDKATLTIQVDKSWVSDNALAKEDITLFKFDEAAEQWNELTTTYTEDDDTYYYYDVELTSFSYFAIGQKVAAEEVEKERAAAEKEAEERNLTWLWILIGVVVLAVIIGGGIAAKKKQ